MSDIIQVGDTVRSYDFPDNSALADCYVEGVVEAIGEPQEGDPLSGSNCSRYKIKSTRTIWMGEEIPEAKGRYVYPPVNGSSSWLGGKTAHGVEKLS